MIGLSLLFLNLTPDQLFGRHKKQESYFLGPSHLPFRKAFPSQFGIFLIPIGHSLMVTLFLNLPIEAFHLSMLLPSCRTDTSHLTTTLASQLAKGDVWTCVLEENAPACQYLHSLVVITFKVICKNTLVHSEPSLQLSVWDFTKDVEQVQKKREQDFFYTCSTEGQAMIWRSSLPYSSFSRVCRFWNTCWILFL